MFGGGVTDHPPSPPSSDPTPYYPPSLAVLVVVAGEEETADDGLEVEEEHHGHPHAPRMSICPFPHAHAHNHVAALRHWVVDKDGMPKKKQGSYYHPVDHGPRMDDGHEPCPSSNHTLEDIPAVVVAADDVEIESRQGEAEVARARLYRATPP